MWHTEIAATENVKKCILSCAVTGYFNILLKLIWLIVNYICSFKLYITEPPFFLPKTICLRDQNKRLIEKKLMISLCYVESDNSAILLSP